MKSILLIGLLFVFGASAQTNLNISPFDNFIVSSGAPLSTKSNWVTFNGPLETDTSWYEEAGEARVFNVPQGNRARLATCITNPFPKAELKWAGEVTGLSGELLFTINGVPLALLTGNEIKTNSVNLPRGEHLLQWTFIGQGGHTNESHEASLHWVELNPKLVVTTNGVLYAPSQYPGYSFQQTTDFVNWGPVTVILPVPSGAGGVAGGVEELPAAYFRLIKL